MDTKDCKPFMEAKVIGVDGIREALFGVGMSRGITSDISFDGFIRNNEMLKHMSSVADTLAGMDGGHNKFLESIVTWIDIKAPRYWWQEADTYRVGITKQSESTMHRLEKRGIAKEDFEICPTTEVIGVYNQLIKDVKNGGTELFVLKSLLPEGFLQKRITCVNYKTLRNIYFQRRSHRLPHWHIFIDQIITVIPCSHWITTGKA